MNACSNLKFQRSEGPFQRRGVAAASADDLYGDVDWLLQRQGTIQKKLAARHLGAGSLVLYDLSSSYFEGSACPLAKLGYSVKPA